MTMLSVLTVAVAVPAVAFAAVCNASELISRL